MVRAPAPTSVSMATTTAAGGGDCGDTPAAIRLSPLDHGMMLTCLNPKAMWLPYDLDGALLAQALSTTLGEFPILAGRCDGRSASVFLGRLAANYRSLSERGSDAAALAAGPPSGLPPPPLSPPPPLRSLPSPSPPPPPPSVTSSEASAGGVGGIGIGDADGNGGNGGASGSRDLHYQQMAEATEAALDDGSGAAAPSDDQSEVSEEAAAAVGALSALSVRPLSAEGLLSGLRVQQVASGGGWRTAVSAAGKLLKAMAAERRRWRAGGSGGSGLRGGDRGPQLLTCEVLHLPASEVARLKALATGGAAVGTAVTAAAAATAAAASPAAAISTNDAVTALVWVLMCELRGRPLPGAAATASSAGGGYMGLAIDIRRNGRLLPASPATPATSTATATSMPAEAAVGSSGDGAGGGGTAPAELFANAVWCLHVPAPTPLATPSSSPLPVAGSCRCGSGGNGAAGGGGGSGGSGGGGGRACLVFALRSGAAAVRRCVRELREAPDGAEQVLRTAALQLTAPLSDQAAMMARVCCEQDAMMTSWQMPYWDLDFGSAGPIRNQPVQFQSLLAPSPPWTAAVMAAAPPGRLAAIGGSGGGDDGTGAGGGLNVFLVVPEGAAAALRGSRVVRELVPGAAFQ
ncbi:hypothetical protein GPECTOR_13g623 [Gonium pectorale]|uniref:Uncharacterized protein n=1 Tax=Gonium pectorale TaxID=33097 RepID=A0A150GMN9_GONPE|nr:hypothetical protein GPECTOR_13g623 [Gonium pectorale]|eukprot:KXZ51136.1 hypothetical protein GPECTOR_13g623 [Gonium pectorale]